MVPKTRSWANITFTIEVTESQANDEDNSLMEIGASNYCPNFMLVQLLALTGWLCLAVGQCDSTTTSI